MLEYRFAPEIRLKWTEQTIAWAWVESAHGCRTAFFLLFVRVDRVQHGVRYLAVMPSVGQ